MEYTRAKSICFKKHVLHFDFSISCPHSDLANYSETLVSGMQGQMDRTGELSVYPDVNSRKTG